MGTWGLFHFFEKRKSFDIFNQSEFRIESSKYFLTQKKMKLFSIIVASLIGVEAKQCLSEQSRGPRPDNQDSWVPTEAPTKPNGNRPNPPQGPQTRKSECTDWECDIQDYNDRSISSWRTNCPSGCHIKEYMDEMKMNINDQWAKTQRILDATMTRTGKLDGNLHVTLNEIMKQIKEVMNSLKKEKDQFLEIQKIYNAANMPGILADQQIKLAELLKKKTQLQIKLSDTQKKFKEEAAFCKVSFREYDEMVCDITDHVTKY